MPTGQVYLILISTIVCNNILIPSSPFHLSSFTFVHEGIGAAVCLRKWNNGFCGNETIDEWLFNFSDDARYYNKCKILLTGISTFSMWWCLHISKSIIKFIFLCSYNTDFMCIIYYWHLILASQFPLVVKFSNSAFLWSLFKCLG